MQAVIKNKTLAVHLKMIVNVAKWSKLTIIKAYVLSTVREKRTIGMITTPFVCKKYI